MDRASSPRDAGAELPGAEFDRLVVEAVEENGLPGLSIVVRVGGATYSRHLGRADIREDRAITADTVFRLGSVTKTFTALAVVQLAEEGRLQLDAPVNDYLTTLTVEGPSPHVRPITVRQLLTHTSGVGILRKTADVFRPMSGLAADVGQDPPALPLYYGGKVRAELEPCRAWIYTNHGYAALGQMIEDVTGTSLREHMASRIFRPLGMLNTRMSVDDSLRAGLATGYSRRRGMFSPVEYREVIVAAAGAAVSTPADLTLYLGALLGDGGNESGRVVSPDGFGTMLEPHYQLHAELPAMGLGFALRGLGGNRIVWHNGAWIGFASILLFAPERHTAVAIVTNTRTRALDPLGWSVMRLLLGVEPAEEAAPYESESDGSERRDLSGIYEPTFGLGKLAAIRAGTPRPLVVRQKHGRLSIRPQGRGSAHQLCRDRVNDALTFYFVRAGERETVIFNTDERGKVDSLSIALYRLRKRRRRGRRESALRPPD
jgi:CubicO group peptidase (beta-lactamase class C family)